MVVSLHQKHSWFDLGVPHEDVVVETCRKDHWNFGVPIKCVDAVLMTIREDMLQFESVQMPKDNFLVHAC
jgi:hypothetical protein